MKLKIKGDIIPDADKWIYDFFDIDGVCPKDVESAIDQCADGEDLDVEISSGGGDVIAGSEIYSALSGYKKGALTIRVTGLAASAASVIAMAGRCEMARTALMMIHNTSTVASGDYRDMEHAAEVLRAANEAIRSAYKAKTGHTDEELAEMMDRETWIPADKAVELGFADGIMNEGTAPLAVAASFGTSLSAGALEKLRGKIEAIRNAENKTTDNGTDANARAEADYKFLMLKGAQK